MNNSVYIHIPFCDNICSYCDFCKQFYNENLVNKYLIELEKEIKSKYQGEILKTIYIGGGTPSSLNTNELEKLFNIIKIFKLDNDYEFTIEVNPESINEEKLILFKNNHVNRISIGIESTNLDFLKYLNRKYTYEEAKEKVLLINKYFNNINVDLIYGLENETIKDLEKDIDNILLLPITHISTYSLIIENNTVLSINKTKNINEELDELMYKTIIKKLANNNFKHYEISNFSKDNYESKHNLVYWNNKNYYGFGLGASGYIENIRYDNTRSMSKYLEGNYILNKEILNIKDIISYELILGFRKIDGINIKEFYDKYQTNILDLYNIKELIEKNILIVKNDYIKINYDMIYVMNNILVNFVGE